MSFASKIGAKLQILKGLLADREWADVPFDNTPPWLGRTTLDLMKQKRCATKPMYAYGVTAAAALAKVLNIPRITVVEFGVAGGWGLLAMEAIAASVEKKTGIGIDVVGFDTGVGLPKPEDYRDQPNMWFEGQLPMDRPALEAKLTRATLQIGNVRETLPYFLAGRPAPIGFVSQDFDLWSSTRDALTLYEADYDRLLPRVVTYFDDILGHTYNDFCGERRAIHEFNESFATAVERIGGARWLATQAGDAARAEYAQYDARRQQFRALTFATRRRLQAVYDSPQAKAKDWAAVEAMKREAMAAFRADFAAMRSGWPPQRQAAYDAWAARANNATFGAQAAYDDLVPGFEALFEREGRDWPRFYAAVKKLAALPKDERHAALQGVAPPAHTAGTAQPSAAQ